MKNIVLITAAVSFAVLQGCTGRTARNNDTSAAQQTAETEHVHNHPAGTPCPSEASHGTHESHEEHVHLPGHEGHEEHDHHAAHEGHNHATDHEGHAHLPGHEGHEGHDHGAHGEAAENPDEIVFPAAQAARTDFAVEEVKRGAFRETLRCGGEIYASQSEISVVSAPIAGVVTFVDGRVIPNSAVSAGQGLFRLSSGGLASGDAVQKARIAFHQAEADFQRIEALYADKLVTQRDYLAAEAEYLRAKAEYDPVKISDEKGTLIKAPATGYVLQMSVAPGDYVEIGQPLATIAKSGRMQLRALVSQRYFNLLSSLDDASFRTPASETYYRVSELGGRLYTAGRIIPDGSTLVPVVFEFDAAGRFPDGAYADVVLLGRERTDVVSVPLSALTEQQGLYYVYVQLDADCYRRQQVWRGADDGVNVEIVRGLEGGERIVTRGAVNVKMASASGAIPHGHTH